MRRRFADFVFDSDTGELRCGTETIALQTQPARLLALLTSAAGELVSREKLRDALWDGDTHVDFERCINFYVRQLRRALGDNARTPRFIETLPRRGYRFLARVEELSSGHAESHRDPVEAGRRPGRGLEAASTRTVLAAVVLGLVAGSVLGGVVGHTTLGSPVDEAISSAVHRTLGIEAQECPLRSWVGGASPSPH